MASGRRSANAFEGLDVSNGSLQFDAVKVKQIVFVQYEADAGSAFFGSFSQTIDDARVQA